jgi:hypothetical protein
MSNQFTGTFVLDDSQAQSTIQKTNNQLTAQERKIQNNQNRLSTYFSWAMHMANIWGNYIAHQLEGTKYAAQMATVTEGLQIMSAELSIALTAKRAASDIAQGNYGAGAFQLALAASMQYILIDMRRLKMQAEREAARAAQMTALWNAYRSG